MHTMQVFVHIPKTGGSSLRDQLSACAASHNQKHAYGAEVDFLKLSAEEQAKYMVVQSHMGYGIHLQPGFPVHRRNCTKYITVTDRAVRRAWSQYQFFNNNRAALGQEPMSPADFYRTKQGSNQPDHPTRWPTDPWSFNGSMSWQLCCWQDHQHEAPLAGPGASDGAIGGVRRPFEIDPSCPKTSAERGSCAIKRLCNDYAIAGVRENLDTTIELLGHLMQCSSIVNAKHRTNTRARRLRFGPSEFEMLHGILTGEGAALDVVVGDVAVGLEAGDNERRCDLFHPGMTHPSVDKLAPPNVK